MSETLTRPAGLEQIVRGTQLADQMIAMRDRIRGMLGDAYADKVAGYEVYVLAGRDAWREQNAVAVALRIAKGIDEVTQRTSLVVPMLICAAVEIVDREARGRLHHA